MPHEQHLGDVSSDTETFVHVDCSLLHGKGWDKQVVKSSTWETNMLLKYTVAEINSNR